jgi:two-component system sensor histidine kinase KdpD
VRQHVLYAVVLCAALTAACTVAIELITPSVPVRSAGVVYLIGVLVASIRLGLWAGLGTSVASALAYNFFFLPPRHTLNISRGGDWLTLLVFAVVAVVTSQLASVRERLVRERVEASALRRSDALKTSLLRAVSHDLRSPLQAISAAAGALEQRPGTAEERELLDTILTEADRLNRLVGDLLDLSRLQAGALASAPDWCDPRDLVEGAQHEAASVLEPDRIELAVDADLPLVRVDARQLQHVLVNLLDNAARYAPAGTRVRLEARRGQNGSVDIAVADRGPGIAPAEQRRVFEPFYRGERGGSGLGLAIARGLAEANDARLELTSEPGRGSTFTLRLKAAAR